MGPIPGSVGKAQCVCGDVFHYPRVVTDLSLALHCPGNLRGLVRQLSIDQFENEGRRVSMGTDSVGKPQRTPLFERNAVDPGVHKVTILLNWFEQGFCTSGSFMLGPERAKLFTCIPLISLMKMFRL